MLLKHLISRALFLSSVSYLTMVAGAPKQPEPEAEEPSATSPEGPECTCGNPGPSDSASPPSPSGGGGGGGASAPHFVIYGDMWVDGHLTGAPKVSEIEGYNVFALAFLLSDGPYDQAAQWASLDDSKRKEIKGQYKEAGIKLIVSAFGATDHPTTAGEDPKELAGKMADWVIQNDLDGIDVDYEDMDAMNLANGKAEEWLSVFTKSLREKLPQGDYIITHAPVAPWFNAGSYQSGAYAAVHKNVGDMIDWYNIQFYNQNDYDDCDTLLGKSKTKTSIFEIIDSGVDQSKVVLGKPGTAADATNGFVEPSKLAKCVSQAKEKGWNAGVMVWQYPNAGSDWIKAVRGDAFPLGK